MNKNNKPLLASMFSVLGFVGFHLFKAGSLGFIDFIVALVFGAGVFFISRYATKPKKSK